MQIQTTLRFHLTPVRIAIIKETKKSANIGKDKGVGRRSEEELLVAAYEIINYSCHCGNQYGGSSKN
jgi:hypothetical protein